MLKLSRGELQFARLFLRTRAAATLGQPAKVTDIEDNEEFTATPEYPKISDVSFKGRKQQKKQDWYEELRNVPTIEEKMIKLNMPRYYGYKVVDFNDKQFPYNALPLVQHYTRTALEKQSEKQPIPDLDQGVINKQLEVFIEATRAAVIDGLEFVHDFVSNSQRSHSTQYLDACENEKQITQMIVEQINRTMVQVLASDYRHLTEMDMDYKPRHEAFWAVGGIEPPKNVVKAKEGQDWQKEYVNDPVDRLVQYTGEPYLALRYHKQLGTWKSEAESTNIELAKQLPRYNFDARTLGYSTKHQHAVNVPGYWPGSVNGFGFLSFQSRAHLLLRPTSYGPEDIQDALDVQAIQSSYAWLLAQAYYNGFNTYNELTYPLNTQTIITNGRDWSFYEYQLNTVLINGEHVDNNPRLNYCRGTPSIRLYEEITPEGKCIGLNDEVLRQLIRCYTNVPTIERSIVELQPYVASPTLRYIADYEDENKREFLDRTFKHLSSKRSRHLELPEIYLWEKIYKIDNKTRPMEPKRRFFERGINPWRRTLDQHDKEYIPRAERPGGPKSRDRFKKTYYP